MLVKQLIGENNYLQSEIIALVYTQNIIYENNMVFTTFFLFIF